MSEQAVGQLEQELAQRPGDPELRQRLAWALKQRVEDSLSVTVYDVRVITTAKQREICRDAATRIPQLAPHDQQLAVFAADLADDLNTGDTWTWQSKPVALTLGICAAAVGLALVLVGAFADTIPLIVAAAVLSSAALAGVVLAFRRQQWQVSAKELQPLLRP
ncbi:hypothetical protein [Amycolatopsis mediterranei]|uniref:Uncharacterized protein n=1 Tax=Amycolatopsis mediterranei (strain S699) TaxID=713604 RepID=A0A9R0UE34_AMYMS|nr:hypothetical protein [Amycolatopsis mediterranei]AEK47413.1 hypothetical protein RAM_44730 [Amycolatopsis mediterranei S699]UZF75392.1 hypothetical protein ISP_008980 [Amycolatopsis mediterranei]